MDRNLDGVYFRVQRNGKWENVCFSDLSRNQKEKILENRDNEWLKNMCIILGETIKRMGDKFDIATE